MIAILEAALAYAEHGWPVLPLLGPERHYAPLRDPRQAAVADRLGGGGQHRPDTIRSWWRARPDSNVGLATGMRSGLAVVDVDPRSGGTDSLAALDGRVGVLPGTVMSRTRGGGLHLLYAHPGHKVTSSSHQLGRGLDVKADGGQIVAPPSVHPERHCVRLARRHLELPPWPEVLRPPPAAAVRPLRGQTPGVPTRGGRGGPPGALRAAPRSRWAARPASRWSNAGRVPRPAQWSASTEARAVTLRARPRRRHLPALPDDQPGTGNPRL